MIATKVTQKFSSAINQQRTDHRTDHGPHAAGYS